MFLEVGRLPSAETQLTGDNHNEAYRRVRERLPRRGPQQLRV